MAEVFQLARRLIGKNGTSIVVNIATTSDEATRDQFEAFEMKWIQEIAKATVTVETPQGPRQLMSVLNLFALLGIENVGMVKSQHEVKESALVQPISPRLVLP